MNCDHIAGLGYGGGLSMGQEPIRASESQRTLIQSFTYCPLCGGRLCSGSDETIYKMLEESLAEKSDERGWWINQLRWLARQLEKKPCE